MLQRPGTVTIDIYTHPFSSVHLLQGEGRSRLGVACLASATAWPRSSFCLCSQGFRSFLAAIRVSDRAVLAAVPVRRLHQPQTGPRRANRHRVAHTASSLLSAKAPGGVSMRTVPAAVSELPGHHTATQGAFAETRHCSRAFMYLVKEMFAARSANSGICPPSMICISTICTGQPKEPPNVSRLQAKCAGGLAGQPNEPPNLSKINATHVSAKTKFYAAIPNRHFSCCSRFNAKILDLLSFSIFF